MISPTFLIGCPVRDDKGELCTWNVFADNWREALRLIFKWDDHMADRHPGVM